MRPRALMRYYQSFLTVIPLYKVGCPRVTHPSATRLCFTSFPHNPVRLACVKHAASVHPEPGSNSHVLCSFLPLSGFFLTLLSFLGSRLLLHPPLSLWFSSSDFQGRTAVYLSRSFAASFAATPLIYHSVFALSTAFFLFFIPRSRRWNLIVSHHFVFCQQKFTITFVFLYKALPVGKTM